MDASPLPRKIFVAFDAPEKVYAYHAAVQSAISVVHAARKHQTDPHITVKAPMLVSQARADEVRGVLHDLVDTGTVKRFAVELGEIDMFPKSGAIHLVVDGGAIRPQTFSIINALAYIGFPRGFYEGLVPHITLVKPHKWHRQLVRQIIEELDHCPRGRFMIERLRIFTRHGIGSGEWDDSESLQLR